MQRGDRGERRPLSGSHTPRLQSERTACKALELTFAEIPEVWKGKDR